MESALELQVRANADGLKKGLAEANNLVLGFGEGFAKSLKLSDGSLKTLGSSIEANLGKSLRIANGNFELFGNELDSNRAKLAAYKQALNQLLSEGFGTGTKQVQDVTDKIRSLNAEVSKAPTAFSKTTKETGNANYALQNLGRIASDAPYGFIAIQNNIDPLIQSFQGLKAQTGSTGAALKALVGGLVGPAGIALAFSVAAAAATYFIQNPEQFDRLFNSISGGANTAVVALRAFNDAKAEIAKSSAGEIASLNALISAGKNENLTRAARTAAINEAKREYPGYLDFLTIDNIKSKETAIAVQALTKALQLKAQAQAYSSKIADLESQKLNETNKTAYEAASTLDVLNAGFQAAFNPKLSGTLQNKFKQYLQPLADETRQNNSAKIAAQLDLFYKKLQETVNTEALDDIYKKLGDIDKRATGLKNKKIDLGFTGQLDPNLPGTAGDTTFPVATPESLKTINDKVTGIQELTEATKGLTLAEQLQSSNDEIKAEAIRRLNENTATAVQLTYGLANIFSNAFTAQDPFKAILQSIKQLIVQLLATLAAAAAVAAILSFIPGFGAAGVGLKSFQGIFQGIGSSIGGLSGAAIGGLTKSATVNPGGGIQNILLESRIDGADIILSNARTISQQRRLG